MTAFPGVTVMKHGTSEEVMNWLTDGQDVPLATSNLELNEYIYILDVRARSEMTARAKARGHVRLDYPTAFSFNEVEELTERDVSGTPMTVYSLAVRLDPQFEL